MNWALGQTYANTEATRQDVAGIKVDLTHLEASTHADMTVLRTAFDLRISDLRRDLRSTEASIRHDMRTGFESVDRQFSTVHEKFDAVHEKFNTVDERFNTVDERFNTVDERFDGLEAKVDMILAEIRGEKRAANRTR